MLKKSIFIAITLPILLQATTITKLLNSLEHRTEHKLDMLEIEQSSLGVEAIRDKRMPVVNLYGGYEIYNRPNGMVPVVPDEMSGMLKDPSIAQPFSKQILRGGVEFSFPIYIKSLYTLEEQKRLLHLASKDQEKIHFIQREAVVVGSVANLRYLNSLKVALNTKRNSIEETQRSTKLKVDEGRMPPSAMFVLSSHINELDIAINNIEQQINIVASKIETITGIHIDRDIDIRAKRVIRRERVLALEPLRRKIDATQKGVQASKEALYPSLITKGSYTYSQADAYNNDKSVGENFATAGLYIKMPLYDRAKDTKTQQAKIEYMKSQTELEQTKHALEVQAKSLNNEIALIKRSITLSQKSIQDQEKLLKIAKVSLDNESITQEEYLRYEDALADAKANLYKFRAKEWLDIAQLAVIYGNDLREIVK